MTYKLIGALLIISGCGAYGLSLVSKHKQTENSLRQVRRMIEIMESELEFHLSPLPELCKFVSEHITGTSREVMMGLYEQLTRRVSPDAGSCMQAVLSSFPKLCSPLRHIFIELGQTLGHFDLHGQLISLQYVKHLCDLEIETLYKNRTERIRCYQTLGFCAGFALVIIFV